jgi:hypothetical protein
VSEGQKITRVEAAKEMLTILQSCEANGFGGIATGDESWFRYLCPSAEMVARSPADVVPRTRQTIDAKRTMIEPFFTARKLIVLEVLPKGRKFKQQYFIDYIFPDLKRANMNFHRREIGRTFWVHMDNSLCHNGSKITSKFAKHHFSRMPHPPDSPDIRPCDF